MHTLPCCLLLRLLCDGIVPVEARLKSLWTAVLSCRGGSFSSDWKLIGTYKAALSKTKHDEADVNSRESMENAEPTTRVQGNRTFVRSMRRKKTKNEAPGKGHGRYNLAQASPPLCTMTERLLCAIAWLSPRTVCAVVSTIGITTPRKHYP